MIVDSFLEVLVCPRDKQPLQEKDQDLCCAAGHRYPVVDGIPILLVSDVAQTHPETLRALDARFLPFRASTFDVVFSYSVFQHLSKEDVRLAPPNVAYVLRAHGTAMIEMPNPFGLRSLYHQARRGFRKPRNFNVRYWTLGEMRRAFGEAIGPSSVIVDGYFGLGIQPANMEMFSPAHRFVVHVSEALRAVSKHVRFAAYFADSLYVISQLSGQSTRAVQRLAG